ncbi:MAG: hypothetical protein HKN57_09620 [Xanthomonadales bacterium]|nr:hypothetical protein [Gammaproteobacteria bacterium]NND57501.1 hypothetical protein [Xanthomonadales bacterium]NNK51225.1 hypothetical protein [Xanthomonadales bacterium]
MDDKLKKFFDFLTRQQKHKNHRHLQSDDRAAGTSLFLESAVRPHISLKARMLGGRAKTVMRLGGSMR